MKRTVFTFGTLYEEKIIETLLGYLPEYFLGTLNQYSVYSGDQSILSEELKQDFISKGRDLSTFKFLFAKKDRNASQVIEGKAYILSSIDELFLDWWERYPKWYRKEDVVIEKESGENIEAFIYTLDKEGEKLDKFSRDPNNNLEQSIANARKLRERVKSEFPLI